MTIRTRTLRSTVLWAGRQRTSEGYLAAPTLARPARHERAGRAAIRPSIVLAGSRRAAALSLEFRPRRSETVHLRVVVEGRVDDMLAAVLEE